MAGTGAPTKSELALASEQATVVRTLGGWIHLRLDEGASAMPSGKLAFFAEFLGTAQLFDRWVQDCTLHCTSPNASMTHDVLGTLMVGILAGSRRYANIGRVRGDAVAALALGMSKLVSENSVRRAFKAMSEEDSDNRMREAPTPGVRQALNQLWMLDLDAAIKPLYEHQRGAEVGFNPHKLGKPNHVLNTYRLGNTRLVPGAQLHSGNEHSPRNGLPALGRILNALGPDKQPELVRGDCGYDNEDVIALCEGRGLRHLLRLRHTNNEARLIERVFERERWTRATELRRGWPAVEDQIELQRWSPKCRAVVLRRRIQREVAVTAEREGQQMVLALPYEQVVDDAKPWEFSVLVTDTDTDYAFEAIGQLYRSAAPARTGSTS